MSLRILQKLRKSVKFVNNIRVVVEKAPTKSANSVKIASFANFAKIAKNCKIREQCERVVRKVVDKAPTKSVNSAKNCKMRQQFKRVARDQRWSRRPQQNL